MIRTYAASDYAGAEAGKFRFYYGYEVTVCKKHGVIDGGHSFLGEDETNCECEDAEWAFQASYRGKDGDKLFATIPTSKLGKFETDSEAMEGLVRGMAMIFEEKSKQG